MEIKKQLPLEKAASTFDLIIPEFVESKIRHLCNVVPNVEWSGTLFYTTEGSFEDNLKVICKDIFVMDVGNATFTEFSDSPDIVTYRIEHPELLQEGIYEGLIHSHNNMARV